MMNARLEELRSKFQENPRRYFAPFANELRKAGDPAQAIAVCRAQLAGQPGHVSGHIVLGQALYEAGDVADARGVFTTALDLDPENLIALRTLGELAQGDGEFGMARQWYERLLDADPRNAEVSQLLRDLPTEKPAPAPVIPDVAEAALPEALPDGANPEFAPKPAPIFHTSFTGSGPAYKSGETDEEPSPEARTEPSDFAPPALVESAGPDQSREQSVPAAAQAETEMLDMIDDVDVFASSAPASAPEVPAESSLPDESFDASNVPSAEDVFDADLESATMRAPESEAETRENAPVNEIEIDVPDESTSQTPAAETTRAMFAENGFEGPADDKIGWMSTPSAALSDLESAPENWFDEPPAAETDQQATEPRDETAAVEMSEDRADSWFDEVESASVPDSVEAGAEEFWLPPELPQVSSAEDAQSLRPDDQEALVSAEADAGVALTDDTADDDAVVMASAESDAASVELESFSVTSSGEEFDETVVSDPGAESEAGWTDRSQPEPEQSTQPQEPEPAATEGEPAFAENVIGHTPDFIDAESPPAPFVTETLAELYLQQGFRDEALAIYRRLLEIEPGSESFRLRIQEIEEGAASEDSQLDAPIEGRTSSQSVRSFFSRLARRAAVAGPASSATPSGTSQPDPEIPFAAAASALANLFSAANPPAADEGAAATLAGAFTDPAGRPSRAADRELSLDHLFREFPPGGSASAGVSLDEFYATPIAPPGSPTEPGEGEGSAEPGGTDIRQFTAWLEGLRKK